LKAIEAKLIEEEEEEWWWVIWNGCLACAVKVKVKRGAL
jgi:hypothetical protein